jgi:hypothetical protein
MTRKIIFSMLTLVMVTVPAAAQYGGNLTSFSDRSGDRVLYIADTSPYGGDVHQFWLNGTQPVDTDGTQWYRSMGSTWAQFGSLTSFSDGDGQHVFYIGGTDHHIHQLRWSWSTSSGSDTDWTAMAGSQLLSGGNLTGFSDGRGQHVYYIALNSSTLNWDIHHIFAVGAGKPIDENLTLIAGPGSTCASPQSVLTSYSDGSTELVYYVGPTGHICELAGSQTTWWVWDPQLRRWVPRTFWTDSSYDLTALSASTPAMVNSPLTGFADANGQNEFYVGTNHHVYQLRLSRTGVWFNQDLTAKFGGKPAAGDSLTSFSNSFGEQVFYAGTDQHVYRINLTAQTPTSDLTTLDGGALAMPLNPSVCQFGTSLATIASDTTGLAVYYIGVDQHVYRLNHLGALDQTATYGGVAAGLPGSGCPIM